MLLWLVACTVNNASPIAEARSGGRGFWPANSPTAVEGAMRLELDGIELDVVMTQDDVPVLWASDVLRPPCELEGGEGLPLDISATFYDDLRGARCGGEPDARYPNALVVPEPLLRLDAVLETLRQEGQPELRVHLHLHEPDSLPDDGWHARMAAEVLVRWRNADPPQSLVISSESLDQLDAVQVEARRLLVPLITIWRVHPEVPTGLEPLHGVLSQASGAGVGGVGVHWTALRRTWATRAASQGLMVVTYPVNGTSELSRAMRWPLFGVMTDYPADVTATATQP